MAASYGELIAGLRQTFESGRTRPIAWRREQLAGLVQFLVAHEDELIEALRTDLGKPPFEAYGTDIGVVRMHIRDISRKLDRWMKPDRVFPGLLSLPGTAEVIKEPLGVVLVIAPWNYPVQLLLEPVAAALAAGNCVVAKPSELAPATASVLARHLHRFVDPDAVALVEGGVPETTALLENRFDHVFFTGSTAVGRVVMAAAAKHLTPVTLELGGKSPTIVAADADLAVAARRITWAKFMNAGQTCIAPDYLLVERSVRDELVDRIQGAIREFYGTDPKVTADLGRIVNERHHDRLTRLVSGSGGVVCGGDHDRSTRYLAPTIVLDPDVDSGLMSEEIFGPVLPVLAIDSVEDAIAFVNDRDKPLALYVYTRSKETADRVLARTSSGGACVNHSVMHILPENLPFGGVGPSGMGAYHGKAGFDVFSHHKSVLRKPTFLDPKLLYPPYALWKAKIMRAVFR
ncbi:MAG: aldehyde dehydrogenase family protein [Microthrixaceae bacterium]|nr:aldehyde dehydrogenase family protein [Microthrixaceae bacterium]